MRRMRQEVVPRQEDVAGHALDGEILVHGSHRHALRLGHHQVLGGVRDGAARENGGHARAAASAHAPVHGIAMQVRAGAPARSGDAFGQGFEDRVEIRAREGPVGPGAAHEGEQVVLIPVLGSAGGHHLLGQDIERVAGDLQAIEFPAADGAHQRGALDQLVAGGGEEAALGQRAHPVASAADALQPHGDGARRADLAHQVHRADIDPQLQRSGGHHRAQLAIFQPPFGLQAQSARQAAVVRQDGVRRPAARQAGGPCARPCGAY